MKIKRLGWIACSLVGATTLPAASGQQFTVTLENVPGQNITGGAVVLVEAFLTNNGPDARLDGTQIDLPCILPGAPGSSGTAMTVGNALSVGNASNAASGAIPWMFASIPPNTSAYDPGFLDCAGLRPIAQAACRAPGSGCAGEPPYTIPAGAKRYLGTWRYTVSQCAAGTFNIPYESFGTPCQITDLTRIVDENLQCVSANFIPGSLTVVTGSCCDGMSCGCDGVNRVCCESGAACPGFTTWTPNGTCEQPGACACTSDAQCPDNFCEPRSCVFGICMPDAPPACPGSTPCSNAICDPAANGGAGGCVFVNKPSGFACGSAADTECDNPNTCNGAGACAANHELDGTPCNNAGPCTIASHCSAGVCTGPPVDCDDGVYCNGMEFCNPATGCASGTPPCAADETCDEVTDTCHPAVIPTVSAWGLAALGLILLTSAKLRFGRRVQS